MLKLKLKSLVFILCVNLLFSQEVFSAKKDKQSLARINKEIENKRKATAKLEKEQKKLSEEIRQTQKKMVEIANNVKQYERKLSGFDKQLSDLQWKEFLLNKKIEGNNTELIKIIAVFENISQVPKGYLLISPARIDTVFQSSILLRSLADELTRSTRVYRQDLNDLIKTKDEITVAKTSIHTLTKKVRGEKNKIANLIKNKKSTQKKLTSKQEKNKREIKRLVAESKTIEEFIKKAEKLRKEREKKAKQTKIASTIVVRKASGTAPLPVSGNITTYFGEHTKKGITSKGIYIKPRANSQVISPSDSDVVFSGSFYGFKNLLILHSSDDYYIILGGMKEIFAEEGQNLLSGEPIGEMGDSELYIEIRDKETPINPLKYFKF